METSALIFMASCWVIILGSAAITMTKIIKPQNNGGNN